MAASESEELALLSDLAQSYCDEAMRCFRAEAHFAAALMMAAQLETELLYLAAYCSRRNSEIRAWPSIRSKKKDWRKLSLGELISVAQEVGCLTEELSVEASQVRALRNLLHPGRCVRHRTVPLVALDEPAIQLLTLAKVSDHIGAWFHALVTQSLQLPGLPSSVRELLGPVVDTQPAQVAPEVNATLKGPMERLAQLRKLPDKLA
ncbi:MAG: hypothetical protein ABIF82_00340 [Planctomycetota bacterium]